MIFEVLTSEPFGGVVVISVIGELDMANAPRLRSALIDAIGGLDAPRVVLDLAGVDLLDPTGLGILLDAVKRTRLRGGGLALACAESQVRRDLELTRVIEILPVFETVTDAIASLTDVA